MPKVTKATLRAMIAELGLIPLTDEELDIVLPQVQAHRDAMEKLDKALDLSMVAPGSVFFAEPNR